MHLDQWPLYKAFGMQKYINNIWFLNKGWTVDTLKNTYNGAEQNQYLFAINGRLYCETKRKTLRSKTVKGEKWSKVTVSCESIVNLDLLYHPCYCCSVLFRLANWEGCRLIFVSSTKLSKTKQPTIRCPLCVLNISLCQNSMALKELGAYSNITYKSLQGMVKIIDECHAL